MIATMAELGELILALPEFPRHHAPDSPVYALLQKLTRPLVARDFGAQRFARDEEAMRAIRASKPLDRLASPFPPFGDLIFPYEQMGAVDSLNLFDLDELIIFAFYWANRGRYKRVADIGANLGLHSILMTKAGYDPVAYEPDPRHFQILDRNLRLNACVWVGAGTFQGAVAAEDGTAEFVRVLGNTTSSHLAGVRVPHGDLETITVNTYAAARIFEWADLVKVDAEGSEADILCSVKPQRWESTDAIVEVGSPENAKRIWEHLDGLELNLFAQKIGWDGVTSLDEMPTSYKDGSLFVTANPEMPWGAE